jgi:hypothetical protein
MSLILDHFLILTGEGAPEAELLTEIGLVEGPRNVHPGQGTANRRFFFRNAMLELAYVRDQAEALSGSGRHLRIAERLRSAQASPFGVMLRATDSVSEQKFHGWPYFADYLGPDLYFLIGDNSDVLEEPLCVLMPANMPLPAVKRPPTHPFELVTELRIGVPVGTASNTLNAVGNVDGVTVELKTPHHMEIVFNAYRAGCLRDFRPSLPLTILW